MHSRITKKMIKIGCSSLNYRKLNKNKTIKDTCCQTEDSACSNIVTKFQLSTFTNGWVLVICVPNIAH